MGAGRIVEPTVEQLETALREMLARPAALAAMGHAGRGLVADRYTWAAVTPCMVDAYEEGVARQTHGATRLQST